MAIIASVNCENLSIICIYVIFILRYLTICHTWPDRLAAIEMVTRWSCELVTYRAVLKHEVDGACTVSLTDKHSAGSHQPCDWLRTAWLLINQTLLFLPLKKVTFFVGVFLLLCWHVAYIESQKVVEVFMKLFERDRHQAAFTLQLDFGVRLRLFRHRRHIFLRFSAQTKRVSVHV